VPTHTKKILAGGKISGRRGKSMDPLDEALLRWATSPKLEGRLWHAEHGREAANTQDVHAKNGGVAGCHPRVIVDGINSRVAESDVKDGLLELFRSVGNVKEVTAKRGTQTKHEECSSSSSSSSSFWISRYFNIMLAPLCFAEVEPCRVLIRIGEYEGRVHLREGVLRAGGLGHPSGLLHVGISAPLDSSSLCAGLCTSTPLPLQGCAYIRWGKQ
jgi:hypothetical protein